MMNHFISRPVTSGTFVVLLKFSSDKLSLLINNKAMKLSREELSVEAAKSNNKQHQYIIFKEISALFSVQFPASLTQMNDSEMRMRRNLECKEEDISSLRWPSKLAIFLLI